MITKTLLPVLALAGLFALPAAASPRFTFSISNGGYHNVGHGGSSYRQACGRCNRCGVTTYRERYICGYERCGRPIWKWRTASHTCRHRSYHRGHGIYHGGHPASSRSRYHHRQAHVPPHFYWHRSNRSRCGW